MRVVCLAGGVGGAKLADGLAQVLEPGELTVVVNTGDDFERHSLVVWPDHDTVLYTLAGIADPVQGWGLEGETWNVVDRLAELGESTWFRLGDRDIATHLYRTDRLRRGARPTEVALDLASALGVKSTVLPMTDQPVRTRVRTDDGWLDFQDYFVRLHQEPEVREVAYGGAQLAVATSEVEAAIAAAEAIVVAPSNPVVSIGPIVAVPGVLEAIREVRSRGVPLHRRLGDRRREGTSRTGGQDAREPRRGVERPGSRSPIRRVGPPRWLRHRRARIRGSAARSRVSGWRRSRRAPS